MITTNLMKIGPAQANNIKLQKTTMTNRILTFLLALSLVNVSMASVGAPMHEDYVPQADLIVVGVLSHEEGNVSLRVEQVLKGDAEVGDQVPIRQSPIAVGSAESPIRDEEIADALQGKPVLFFGKIRRDGNLWPLAGDVFAYWPHPIQRGSARAPRETLEGCIDFVKDLLEHPETPVQRAARRNPPIPGVLRAGDVELREDAPTDRTESIRERQAAINANMILEETRRAAELDTAVGNILPEDIVLHNAVVENKRRRFVEFSRIFDPTSESHRLFLATWLEQPRFLQPVLTEEGQERGGDSEVVRNLIEVGNQMLEAVGAVSPARSANGTDEAAADLRFTKPAPELVR